MDHSQHHGGGEHGVGEHAGGEQETHEGCPMIMNFHAGHCETILWQGWTAQTATQFVFSAFGLFAIAFIYEALKYLREKYYHIVAQEDLAQLAAMRKEAGQPNGACCPKISAVRSSKSVVHQIFNKPHVVQTVMHLIQVTISYLLMLVFMTFNYWLCLAVILGAACGYFCFGWIKQQAIDFDEHCH